MSNLPPGVRVSDIPGNRDFSDEEFCEKVADRRELKRLPEEVREALVERLWKLSGEAYYLGYQQGGAVERELPVLRTVSPARRGHLFARFVESLLVDAFKAGLVSGACDESAAQMHEETKAWIGDWKEPKP
jgi:hypothetical protein